MHSCPSSTGHSSVYHIGKVLGKSTAIWSWSLVCPIVVGLLLGQDSLLDKAQFCKTCYTVCSNVPQEHSQGLYMSVVPCSGVKNKELSLLDIFLRPECSTAVKNV
jgi:hypothetical protein